ncbi:hypothetical protein M5D96_012010 [Drosophila gunungcola]|uniref:Uncharacterized protein n=1 Tax=Drosophila gunungcola TaxID=103775 RepID=A0A9P9YDU8_9MUSC|nr:hypothetical protein M5D96_012010 [Drosophila gunungcola]
MTNTMMIMMMIMMMTTEKEPDAPVPPEPLPALIKKLPGKNVLAICLAAMAT